MHLLISAYDVGVLGVPRFVDEEPVALLASSQWKLGLRTLALDSNDSALRALLPVHCTVLGGSLCVGRGELL